MKLYDNAFSPFARKVRLVLDYKGLEYESVDALDPDNKAELARLNPRVEVPALEDDGLVVVNSSDIVAYLDHKYPDRPVLPSDPRLRVEARYWERKADTLLDAILHDISLWTWPVVDRDDSPPQEMLDSAARDLNAVYDELQSVLSGREFLCERISVAEFALFPHLTAVRLLGVPFSKDDHPDVYRWYRQLRTLPEFKADLAHVTHWLATSGAGPQLDKIVWRGDRIEWALANGMHEWFLEEIRSGRVAWPGKEQS